MQKKIEHPRVFISYAWGSEEHDANVISFATDLKKDGIDVVLDKWQLKEGFDTYAFMEKSATDSTITNVLILLDSIYAKKADQRSGGVGTETQIISPEVYNKVEQSKFIPVVFERDEDGNICKPRYLSGLLHFDLTQEDKYDTEYQRLVRRLYGIDTIKEPELGTPPAWLDEVPKVSYKSKVSKEYFKGNSADSIKKKKYKESLSDVTKQIFEYSFSNTENVVDAYIELKAYRDEFLLLLTSSDYIIEGYKEVISSLEEFVTNLRKYYDDETSLKKTLVHELFIYIISYYLKQKNIEAVKYILNKTYFTGSSNFNDDDDSYNSFYHHNQKLDLAICARDDKKYYSGVANLWMELINIDICNKSEFVFADLFCYNCSYLIANYKKDWQWFPITYVYSGEDRNNSFRNYCLKMKSKEHLAIAIEIMGYNSFESFEKKYAEVEEKYKNGDYKEYRIGNCFDSAQAFWNYISTTDLGTRN